MKRSELKNIIKECLIEIFQESFSMNESYRGVEKPKSTQLYKQIENRQQTENFVKQQKPKSLMEDILADTARTTLKSQNSAEGRGSKIANYSDKMSQIVDQTSPEELFGGESAEKWAKLAFFDEKNK
jgi:hypothetical protein